MRNYIQAIINSLTTERKSYRIFRIAISIHYDNCLTQKQKDFLTKLAEAQI